MKKDARRGFALSLEAAEAGVAAAQYDVATCYLAGTGVTKNPVEAERWIRLAAKGGDRDALEFVRKRRKRRSIRA